MAVILLGGNFPGSAPDEIAGLQLWFDAASNVYTDTAGTTPAEDGNTVRSWKDRQNNYLVPDNGAGTGPLLDTDLAFGRPALVFDAVNDMFRTTGNDADSFQATTVFTMFAVVRHAAAAPAEQTYFGFHDATRFTNSLTNTAAAAQHRVVNYDGTQDTAVKAATLTSWGIASAMHSGGNIYVGASDTRDASMASAASGNTTIGANTNLYIRQAPASFAAMDIAELIYYNVAVSEANRMLIEQRLAFKYGIALPY